MEDVWAVREIITDDQNGVALFMGVLLVVLGDREGLVDETLDLRAVPVVEEVLLLLLMQLVAHILLHNPQSPIVVDRRTEDVDCREHVAVRLLVRQEIRYQGRLASR